MECPAIPQISYSEFGRRLLEGTRGRRVPWGGTIEVTTRCNLKCVHCYINTDVNDGISREGEFSTREFRGFVDQFVDEGCLGILITGGEPLVRHDFVEIYLYAKKKGLLVSLFTNGTTITPRMADYLAEWPPRTIEITLYGSTQRTYEAVTRIPGSYSRCVRGIELLLDRGISLELKTVLLTLNKHELHDMRAYAKQLGLRFRYDPTVNVRLDGSKGPAKYRVTPQEAVAVELGSEDRMEALDEFCQKFAGPPPIPEDLYGCGAGLTGFHVDSTGQMSVCITARRPAYDLRRGSFKEGWEEFIPGVRAQKRKKLTPCQSCEMSSLCDQCPGWGNLESGDPEEPVDYLCRLAHLRARALDTWRRRKDQADGVDRVRNQEKAAI